MGKKVHLGYKVSMNLLSDHLLEWSLLVGFLLFLLYAVFAIFKEKKSFLEECYFIEYKRLRFPIPNWWTQEIVDDNTLHFHRTDTRYDWDAHFEWIENDQRDLEKIFDDYIKDNQIEFDKEVIVETNSSHLFKNNQVFEKYTEFIRVEGMASKAKINRVYLDIVFFRQSSDSGYFKMQSLSSVLNGGVEGPYFEEALVNAKIIF